MASAYDKDAVVAVPAGLDTPGVANPLLDALTEAVIAAHDKSKDPGAPTLTQVRDLYRSKNYAAALQALYATDYFKEFTGTKYNNDQLKLNKPIAYEDSIKNDWMPVLRNYAKDHGLAITDANIEAIARKAFDMGLSPQSQATLDFFAAKNSDGKPLYVAGVTKEGTAQKAIDNLKAFAYQNGITKDDGWFNTAAQTVADGTHDQTFWETQIKDMAKSAFPIWSTQIDAGQTVRDVASPYFNSVKNILGVQADFNDPTIQMAFKQKDKDGNPSVMSLYDFETALKKDPRWAYTPNARNELSSVARDIATSLGVAY
jgi:hypothetical protein